MDPIVITVQDEVREADYRRYLKMIALAEGDH